MPTPRGRALVVPLLLVTLAATPAAADLDLVFVLDTTGSMGGELAEAQQRLRELAVALAVARPDERLRFGVVAFRDRGDDYVTRRSPLSGDPADTAAFLSSLGAGGGGDGPEAVLAALAAALREMDWDTADATERRVVLVGDAPPHLDYEDDPTLEELLAEARRRQVVVDTIGCRSLPPEGVEVFRRIAFGTEGSYQHIGRVEAPPAGALVEALGRAAAPAAVELAEEGLELTLTPRGRLSSTAEARVAGSPTPLLNALLVERAALTDGGCALQVHLPAGLALAAAPQVRRAGERLLVTLAVIGGEGGAESWTMAPCPPLAAPVHVVLLGEG